MAPVFLSYVLSFVYVGIYWNNHHHLMHASERVSGSILWANLHLLFWLSLAPFATRWVGENIHRQTHYYWLWRRLLQPMQRALSFRRAFGLQTSRRIRLQTAFGQQLSSFAWQVYTPLYTKRAVRVGALAISGGMASTRIYQILQCLSAYERYLSRARTPSGGN